MINIKIKIFELLERDDVCDMVWSFLNRLPISPVLYERIVKLEMIRDQKEPNWESVLGGKNKYKLLYNLHVIEHLMEEQEGGNMSQNNIISEESDELKELKRNWRSDFIKFGGFDHLFIQLDYLLKDSSTQDAFSKHILSFILKIFRNYIVAAFACSGMNIYKTMTRMSRTYVPLSTLVLSIRMDKSDTLSNNVSHGNNISRLEAMDLLLRHSISNPSQTNFKEDPNKIEESQEFLQLVASLQSQELSEQILHKFDFPSFTRNLRQVCAGVFDLGSLESSDRMIMEHSLLVMSSVLAHKKELSNEFFQEQEFISLVKKGLFYGESQNIRKLFDHSVLMICSHQLEEYDNDTPLRHVLNMLIECLANLQNLSDHSGSYFELFCALLDTLTYYQIRTSNRVEWIDYSSLLHQLAHALKMHHSNETSKSTKSDKVLLGLLNLLDRILTFNEDLKSIAASTEHLDLIQEVFLRCLFHLTDNESTHDISSIKEYDRQVNKAKTDVTRGAAYKYTLYSKNK